MVTSQTRRVFTRAAEAGERCQRYCGRNLAGVSPLRRNFNRRSISRVCRRSSRLGPHPTFARSLTPGVPGDLARAALRRASSSDPAIRDFVGLSENSWDFNAPGAMSGFGPIDKEQVGRLVTQLLGEPDATAVAAHPSQADKAQKSVSRSDPAEEIQIIRGSAGPVPARPQQLDTQQH
jgi:hypothetical protein